MLHISGSKSPNPQSKRRGLVGTLSVRRLPPARGLSLSLPSRRLSILVLSRLRWCLALPGHAAVGELLITMEHADTASTCEAALADLGAYRAQSGVRSARTTTEPQPTSTPLAQSPP